MRYLVPRSATALCAMLLASTALADVSHTKDLDSGETTVRLEVTPADEPQPAFRHRLKYDRHELLPGNAPQWFIRSIPENTHTHSKWRSLTREDEFDPYYSSGTPVSQLDEAQFDEAVGVTRIVDQYLVPGAQRRGSDWGINTESLTGPERVEFLLPEFQASRELARMVAFRVRHAVYEGRYVDAIRYLRTQYRLGEVVADEPILVCGLVGIAITSYANDGALDLIAAPDSPNLYWALSELPSPPVSMGDSMEHELDIGFQLYTGVDVDEHTERSPEGWNAAWRETCAAVVDSMSVHETAKPIVESLGPMALGVTYYQHAKRRLVDWGWSPNEVEAMAVGQVLCLYSARVYHIAADEYRKVVHVPYSQRKQTVQRVRAAERALDIQSGSPNHELLPIASRWLPAIQSARSAEVRCAREVAALRVIEALRMHAARNGGALPTTLEEVTCVPVPHNPATDKPFIYHLDGATAVLELPDWEGISGRYQRYEITLRR